jgi:ABC-type phosphate transport system substrate-binding protein
MKSVLSLLALAGVAVMSGCASSPSVPAGMQAGKFVSYECEGGKRLQARLAADGSTVRIRHEGGYGRSSRSTVRPPCTPITEGVAEDFQKAKKNAVKVTVGISGTGGGFKKFCRGETDISNASRPILEKEMADCKAAGVEYIELPVAFDALTVVMNPQEHLPQASPWPS